MGQYVEEVPRVKTLRMALIMLGAAGLALLVPMFGHGWVFLTVAAMAACLAIPIARDWQRNRFDTFELIHVLGFRYFMFFGVGALWTIADPYNVAYDIYLMPYIPLATFYCLLGYIFMLGGYYGPWFMPRKPRPVEDLPIGPWVLLAPGGLGLVGSLSESLLNQAFWAGAAFSGIVSSFAQLQPLYYFSWALAWLLVLSGRATRSQRMTLYLFFIPMTGVILSSNLTDKSQALMLFAVPLMALWYARRVLPWRSLIIMVLVLIFVVFPFFNQIRYVDPDLPIPTRVQLTTERILALDTNGYLEISIGTFKSRLSLVNSVAIVMRDVPRWVPYESGDTLFMPAMAFFIPRFVWPEKPLFLMGRDFGEKFRIVSILDDKTRISVTVPGELYWNFDLPGILVGMAVWGILMRMVYRRYAGSEGLDPVRRATYMLILIMMVHFGGGIAPQAVGVLRTLLIIEAFCWICRRLGLIQSAPVDASKVLHPKPTI